MKSLAVRLAAWYALVFVGLLVLVVVIFLQGGRPTFGPKAAEIAGRMYRNLYDHNFFVAGAAENLPAPMVEKASSASSPQQ